MSCYRWNVSKKDGNLYRHHCAITANTYTPELRNAFYEQLKLSFPVPEYDITVSYVLETHSPYDLEQEAQQLNNSLNKE